VTHSYFSKQEIRLIWKCQVNNLNDLLQFRMLAFPLVIMRRGTVRLDPYTLLTCLLVTFIYEKSFHSFSVFQGPKKNKEFRLLMPPEKMSVCELK